MNKFIKAAASLKYLSDQDSQAVSRLPFAVRPDAK
jgi:hypothetical protein